MTFEEILDQALAMLQRRGRVTYRTLQRQFNLDDAALEDLKEALLYAHPHVADDPGHGLRWQGETTSTPPPVPSAPQPALRLAAQDLYSTQAEPSPRGPWTPDAERRQLTVLFCDLVDSTVLASQLDPEEWREVVRAYQQTCATVIQRYEGYIAQYLGDGLLVYFGYPHAHEDDPQRAVRTGLEIVEAMGTLHTQLARDNSPQLAVRVGIHTGLVVVGEIGSGGSAEPLALGDTPNIASRLQGLATPNTVVISADTHRLVQGYFTVDALGSQPLKGVTAPLHVYRILGESGTHSRLDVAATRGLTPFVGREQEAGLLLDRWAQAHGGMGQVVILHGEAGIGKSRLLQVLKERVAGESVTRIEFRCSPYHVNSVLYPVIEQVERLLQFRRDDSPEAKLDKLARVLEASRLPLAEVMPLVAALLLLPHPAQYPSRPLSPRQQRQKTQEALVAWLIEETERRPVLAVCEDLHWADPSTLECLSLLVDQAPTARLLLLLTHRPGFRPPWEPRSHLTQLTLGRLGRAQIEAMILSLTGGKPLPADILEPMIARSDGVPLFVEEFTKTVLESGWLRETDTQYEVTGPLPAFAIPATLHDSLMARLDRLITAKGIAQLGATIGRQFPYELLQAVAPLDEATLQRELGRLVEAELLYQRGLPPQAAYTFKHALIQDVAYQSLLKSTRQRYHRQIAQALEALFPDTTATQPELLAHHYTEAGLTEQAIGYWQRAGQHASVRSAHVEAIAHFTRGLDVLKTLPEIPGQTQHELLLQTALGRSLAAAKSYAAPEVAQAYGRALTLCRQVGETSHLFPVLVGLRAFHLVRAELPRARELAEQLWRLAQRTPDPTCLLAAHQALGHTLFHLGELAAARRHLEEGITFYAPQHPSFRTLTGEQDLKTFCLAYMARVLWLLGYPDQARQRSDDALTHARKLAHPYTVVHALWHGLSIHEWRGEEDTAWEWSEAVMTLAREQGLAQLSAEGTFRRGLRLLTQGQGEAGRTLVRQGLAAYRATGAEIRRPYYLALLAEMHGNVGQTQDGLAVLADAMSTVDKTGERWWEAELYRLKGELQVAPSVDQQTEAETCFHQALAIAQSQQAKSLELRVAMSLSRLWQQQGKRGDARKLLGEIYGWFTEGFDTADLQEAKALLEALSR